MPTPSETSDGDGATTDSHDPEILPLESWLDRDDPRFGEHIDADEAPTSLREWNRISAKLTKNALEKLFQHEKTISATAAVLTAYDHRAKAWDLVDDGVLRYNAPCARFELTARADTDQNGPRYGPGDRDGVEILARDAVEFTPEAVNTSTGDDGISRQTATTLVSAFTTCPECEHDIDPDIGDAAQGDRDVHWMEEIPGSSPITCGGCGRTLQVMVEEKAVGSIIDDQLPDVMTDDMKFVPYRDRPQYLVANTSQIFVSVAGNRDAGGESSTSTTCGNT